MGWVKATGFEGWGGAQVGEFKVGLCRWGGCWGLGGRVDMQGRGKMLLGLIFFFNLIFLIEELFIIYFVNMESMSLKKLGSTCHVTDSIGG